jgi:DNA-binding NarL/FixJ family response regulator
MNSEQFGLSPREIRVLKGIAAGLTTFEIAGDMALATGTVRRHTEELMSKLGASSRAEAAIIATEAGIDLAGTGPSENRAG